MLKSFCIYLLLILLIATNAKAQESQAMHNQLKFANYLLRNNLTDDFFTLLHSKSKDSTGSVAQFDSLYLLAGHAYYLNNDNDSAVFSFKKISNSSPVYGEACFNSAYILAETGNYKESYKIIEEYNPPVASEKDLKQLHLESVSLLMRDTANYAQLRKSKKYQSSNTISNENKLENFLKEIKAVHHRSGFLAGTFSALVPGLGKVYAGEAKQGAVTFLPVTILGFQLYEAYKKAGVKSVRFYASAAIFSVFYVANIWGAVLSVTVKRNELNDAINDEILFNLHIPVQSIFR